MKHPERMRKTDTHNRTMFDEFLEFDEELAKNYDPKVLYVIFRSLISIIDARDRQSLTLDFLVAKAKEELARKKLSVLNIEIIVKTMMNYLCIIYDLEEDSFENHRNEAEKVLWKALARHVNNPADYIEGLFDSIVHEFERGGEISVEEISSKLSRKKEFRTLTHEALHYCVETLFDFYVSKGNILIY